ncbi:hypothetical protein AB0E01_31785 [Nocardia vinacea]|uniref:hypothetical protein n=1 Tax=Nocardia vinacea TaxID=96468 RepID=UPI0033D23900
MLALLQVMPAQARDGATSADLHQIAAAALLALPAPPTTADLHVSSGCRLAGQLAPRRTVGAEFGHVLVDGGTGDSEQARSTTPHRYLAFWLDLRCLEEQDVAVVRKLCSVPVDPAGVVALV